MELTRDGGRREWTFGEIATAAATCRAPGRPRPAARRRRAHAGRQPVRVGAGDGRLLPARTRRAALHRAVRPKDLALRLRVARPRLVVCDERNADVLAAAGWDGPTLWIPWGELPAAPAAPHADLEPADPCLITFTSGTAGEPKAVLHGQRYLAGQMLQARHWLDARPDDVVWCTAASGWSKSARNAFVAPWLRGAAALLHDARFDPHERLELLERERVDLLCMAPTEYRVIAKRDAAPPARPARRRLGRRGAQPRGARGLARGDRRVGADGYGQTETGQLTGMPLGIPARARWASSPACGSTSTRASVADPASIPTFCLGYLGEPPPPTGPSAVAHRRPRRARRAGIPALRRPHRRRDHLGRPVGRRSRSSRARLPPAPSPRPRSSPRPTTSAQRRPRVVVLRRRPSPHGSRASSRTTSRPDRALQVPASSTSRRRSPEDRQRQDPPLHSVDDEGPAGGSGPFVRWRKPVGQAGTAAAGITVPMILGGLRNFRVAECIVRDAGCRNLAVTLPQT